MQMISSETLVPTRGAPTIAREMESVLTWLSTPHRKDPGYGTVFTYENNWDAHKIFGCMCDKGYSGYDCSLRECPRGDDPLTATDQEALDNVNEVQLFICDLTTGTFTLTFNGITTAHISVNALAADVQDALNSISSIRSVSVSFSEVANTVCEAGMNQVVSVEFLYDFGNLPSLHSQSTKIANCADPDASAYDACGGTIAFATDGITLDPTTGDTIASIQGNKENAFCSNRGTCDQTTGICSCFTGFSTSDGYAPEGDRGDCGFATQAINFCPGLGKVACSGHGFCNSAPTYVCTCSQGWQGGDCSERTCPVGKAWFDLPSANDVAHAEVECSNMGICDRVTGKCACHKGFEGEACQYRSCPKGPMATRAAVMASAYRCTFYPAKLALTVCTHRTRTGIRQTTPSGGTGT